MCVARDRLRDDSSQFIPCQFCDVLQAVWNLLEEGKLAEAGDLFEKLLPALLIEGGFTRLTDFTETFSLGLDEVLQRFEFVGVTRDGFFGFPRAVNLPT